MERFERKRRKGRPRTPLSLETLEGRALLSWSPLGFSLPDLTVSGVVAPVAAYGQTVAIEAHVENLGASIFPAYNEAQGAPSTADAPASALGVYVSPLPRSNGAATLLTNVPVPAVPQNSVVNVQAQVPLPPAGAIRNLPTVGRRLYVFFRADNLNQIPEADETNNLSVRGVPTLLRPALPDLRGTAFDAPQVVQPGDTLAPTIQIANIGTVAAGPVTVELVASPSPVFNASNATVLATFDPTNVPALASVPPLASVPLARGAINGDINTVYDQLNTVTFTSPQVTTPPGPGPYYVGVIVDPNRTLSQQMNTANDAVRRRVLNPSRQVFQHYRNLPPAGIINPAPVSPPFVFPAPPKGPI